MQPGAASRHGQALRAACFFTLLWAFSAPVSAAWYQVEVILFAHLEADDGGELWPDLPGLPGREGTIELIMDTADDISAESRIPRTDAEANLMPYLALPKQDYRLAEVHRILRLSREYRPLLHVAWQQPGLERGQVRAIHLDNIQFEEKPARQPGADWPDYRPPKLIYDGLVRLRSARFLHLDVDFVYFPEQPEETAADVPVVGETGGISAQGAPAYFRLTQSRRIRLGRLHYFDHPMFGILVQVRRLKPEADEQGEQG